MARSRLTDFKTFAFALGAALLFAGCTVYEHDHRDRPVVVEERRPVVVEEHREVREVPPPVHHERTLIVEGKHLIEFRAPRPGTATVVDADRGEDILTLELRPGDHLTVDPDRNKVYVNDHKVYNHDLKSKHLFRIYFTEHH